jgi:hypothetical protein
MPGSRELYGRRVCTVPAPIGARLMSPTTNATLSPREPT